MGLWNAFVNQCTVPGDSQCSLGNATTVVRGELTGLWNAFANVQCRVTQRVFTGRCYNSCMGGGVSKLVFYAQSSSAVISGGGGTNPVWTGTAEDIAIQFWRRETERI